MAAKLAPPCTNATLLHTQSLLQHNPDVRGTSGAGECPHRYHPPTHSVCGVMQGVTDGESFDTASSCA